MTTTLRAKDYKSGVAPVWCPGCGDFGDLAGFTQTLAALQIAPEALAIVSGIGCSGRFSHFVNCYAYHTAHGRALPTAVGLKAARPDLTVFVVGGDGDGFSIGGGHIPHAARRNPDVTYVVLDNSVYGLTKGQTSPTSPFGMVTGTAPFGAVDKPARPLPMLLSYGTTFVARAFSSNVKQLSEILKAAVRHKGLSVVQAISPCPTFNRVITFEAMKERVADLPDDHDPTRLASAMRYALDEERVYTGVFYQADEPTMTEKLQQQRALTADRGPRSLEGLFEQF